MWEVHYKIRIRRIKNNKSFFQNFLHCYIKKEKINYLLVIFDNSYIRRIMKEFYQAISYILIHCVRSKFRLKNSGFCIGCFPLLLFPRQSRYLAKEMVTEKKEGFRGRRKFNIGIRVECLFACSLSEAERNTVKRVLPR